MRTRILPFAAVAAILLSGCNSGPDYTPIGDGLKAIGICMVVYGVVAALADLIKEEQDASKRNENKPPRKRKSSGRKEDQP
jgi:membrane protein involved in colicin uptake